MNLTELTALIKKIGTTMEELCQKKNDDYSRDTDVHSNFKEVSLLCRMLNIDVHTPKGCIEFFIVVKLHRLFKLSRANKPPSNESLIDTIVDSGVYQVLLATYEEEKGKKKYGYSDPSFC